MPFTLALRPGRTGCDMALDLAASLGLQQFHDVDEAGQPVLDEGESILRVFQRLELVMGTDADAGEGTVFITQGCA